MDHQQAQNMSSSPLEDRLRDMLLRSSEASQSPGLFGGNISPPLPPQFEQDQSFHHPQPPHHPQQLQHNPWFAQQSAAGGLADSQNDSFPQPMNFPPTTTNRRGDWHHGHSRQMQPRFNNRERPPPGFHAAPMHQQPTVDQHRAQWQFLEESALQEMSRLEMSRDEMADKENFRAYLEHCLVEVVHQNYSNDAPKVELACFGSVASGFAMPGSDMDLALVSTAASHDMFRLLEKHLLKLGHGAHLLTRTRVPILKVCEYPTPELLCALREERQKWDDMTPEQREKFDHPALPDSEQTEKIQPALPDSEQTEQIQTTKQKTKEEGSLLPPPNSSSGNPATGHDQPLPVYSNQKRGHSLDRPSKTSTQLIGKGNAKASPGGGRGHARGPKPTLQNAREQHSGVANVETNKERNQTTQMQPRVKKMWFREKRLGPLDFPKEGVGIQCDIVFDNPLGLHNTALLRCYSHCDPRVRLMVLFVKAWASKRKINSARFGSLSSYGYVLLVLHFLVNVAKPPVCPNLQLMRNSPTPPDPSDPNAMCDGWDVRFWRNESEIQSLASKGMMSHNHEPLGLLLRNFFEYYAQNGFGSNGVVGFNWTQEVLSLRTDGGILTKGMKGWTGARNTIQDHVEIRHRYLVAIEDPFELDHNVGRPVTHNGIVAIRDEFRRAWRIICQVGRGESPEGALIAPLPSQEPPFGDKEKEKEKEQAATEVVQSQEQDNAHISELSLQHLSLDG